MENEIKIIIAIILIVSIFELCIIGFAYFAADEVECNLIWCSFKTTRITSYQTCYMNDVLINCTDPMGGFDES